MTIIIHGSRKQPRKNEGRLYFEYFRTARGKVPPKGFNLRVSVTEDPDVRIYEKIFVKEGPRP